MRREEMTSAVVPLRELFRRAETAALLLNVLVLFLLLGVITAALFANLGQDTWSPTRLGWTILEIGIALLLGAGAMMTRRAPRSLLTGVIVAAIALDGIALFETFTFQPWLLGILAGGAGAFSVAAVASGRGLAQARPSSESVGGALPAVLAGACLLGLDIFYGFLHWDILVLLVVSAGFCAVAAGARWLHVSWWPASVAVPLAVVAVTDLADLLGASVQQSSLTVHRAVMTFVAVGLFAVSMVIVRARAASSCRVVAATLASTVFIGTSLLFAGSLVAHGFQATTPVASVRSPDGLWTLSIINVDNGALGGGTGVVLYRDYLGLVRQERKVDYPQPDPAFGDAPPTVRWLNASVVEIGGWRFGLNGAVQK
jgi:hypothetical protein